jgi:hypothetical protein
MVNRHAWIGRLQSAQSGFTPVALVLSPELNPGSAIGHHRSLPWRYMKDHNPSL